MASAWGDTTPPELFVGSWKLDSSVNFDEYLKALGVGLMSRQMARMAQPITTITQNQNEWTIATTTSFKCTEIKFRLGEPFQEITADGRNVNTTCVFNEGKLVQKQIGPVNSTLTREIIDEGTMVLVLVAKDIMCTRVYKRLLPKAS